MGKIAVVLRVLVLLVFVVSAAPPSGASADTGDELISLAKSAGKPVVADFGLGFCMQCKKQAATLKNIGETYGDKVILRMVNVGKEQALTSRYGVELIPTLVFFDVDGKIKVSGKIPSAEVLRKILAM